MKNILLILKNCAVRNRIFLILSVLAGLLIGAVFLSLTTTGAIGYSVDTVYIGVIDNDDSPLSEDLKEYLSETLAMDISEKKSYDELANELLDARISAIIEIPDGAFDSMLSGEQCLIDMTSLDDYANSAFIKSYLETYMQGVNVLASAAGGDEAKLTKMLEKGGAVEKIELSGKYNINARADKLHNAYQLASGLMLIIVAGLTLCMSSTIIADKQLGTYSRMQISSVKPSVYIAGVAIFGIISCTLVNLIVMAFPIIGNIDIGLSYGLALLINELYMLFAVGLSIILGQVLSSNTPLFAFGCGYATIASMLGGAWFPISEELGVLSSLAKLVPQHWYMSIVRKMPGSDYDPTIAVCVLALFALLTYLVSAAIYKRKSS